MKNTQKQFTDISDFKTLEEAKEDHYLKAYHTCGGCSEKMAEVLGVSPRSVRNYKKRLREQGRIPDYSGNSVQEVPEKIDDYLYQNSDRFKLFDRYNNKDRI